jgi:hypothetical protein
MDEYKRRCPDAKKLSPYGISRNDEVMAQIVKEMGEAANGKHAEIKLRPIPVEYKDYYIIQEYDGDENVVIRHEAYTLDAVKSLLKDRALSKADKLARIAAVVNREELINDDDADEN